MSDREISGITPVSHVVISLGSSERKRSFCDVVVRALNFRLPSSFHDEGNRKISRPAMTPRRDRLPSASPFPLQKLPSRSWWSLARHAGTWPVHASCNTVVE